jgi:hypothetical protein
VKEIARFGGDVNHLVPSIVATALKKSFNRKTIQEVIKQVVGGKF